MIVETSAVKAHIDVDPSVASSAKVDVRVSPSIETRIDETVDETGTEERYDVTPGTDALDDVETGTEARRYDDSGIDALVDALTRSADAQSSAHSPQA